MYDIRELENTGTPLDASDPGYADVEDAILGAKDALPISEVRSRAYGFIIGLTAELRESLEIETKGEALLWWSDGDQEDPSNGINVIDAKTANELTEQSAGAIVERVVAYYKRLGRNDGNPAYALYQREQPRDEATATTSTRRRNRSPRRPSACSATERAEEARAGHPSRRDSGDDDGGNTNRRHTRDPETTKKRTLQTASKERGK